LAPNCLSILVGSLVPKMERTKEKRRWILKIYFTNAEDVRSFMKQYGYSIDMGRFGKRGAFGVYSRYIADPGNFLAIISGHVATDFILQELAKEIKRKYPVKTEVAEVVLIKD